MDRCPLPDRAVQLNMLLTYFSSMAIRGSPLLLSLLVSRFTRILFHFRKHHTVKPIFPANFEAESTLFSLLRVGRTSQQTTSTNQQFQGDIFSQHGCLQSEHQPHSLSPVQLPAPVLEKWLQIIPEWEKEVGSKSNWILQYFTNTPKYLHKTQQWSWFFLSNTCCSVTVQH